MAGYPFLSAAFTIACHYSDCLHVRVLNAIIMASCGAFGDKVEVLEHENEMTASADSIQKRLNGSDETYEDIYVAPEYPDSPAYNKSKIFMTMTIFLFSSSGVAGMYLTGFGLFIGRSYSC